MSNESKELFEAVDILLGDSFREHSLYGLFEVIDEMDALRRDGTVMLMDEISVSDTSLEFSASWYDEENDDKLLETRKYRLCLKETECFINTFASEGIIVTRSTIGEDSREAYDVYREGEPINYCIIKASDHDVETQDEYPRCVVSPISYGEYFVYNYETSEEIGVCKIQDGLDVIYSKIKNNE